MALLADSTASMRKLDHCAFSKREISVLDSMRYADGMLMERGDVVRMPGCDGVYRICGWDVSRGLVMLTGLGLSGIYYRYPTDLERGCMPE